MTLTSTTTLLTQLTVTITDNIAELQGWLVPHVEEGREDIKCGLGAGAAVHAGFSTSWQSGLKQAVCQVLGQVVSQPASKPGNMQLLITGEPSPTL